jgi:glycosyltransferase involved in cell wall biosynthesis
MLALATCEYGSTYLCDEQVAVSENTRSFISRIKHVIPNGVDLSRFSPTKDKEKTPTVLFVGTLRGRKRGKLLLDEFRQCVLKKVPGAVLWAVCDEPLDEPNVRWFGRVPDDVLAELYRRAWVFCLPSSYEGFGIPYIEAMASGTAVVSTPNAGAVEVLRKGKCGLIVQENRLGKGIAEILLDSKLRQFLETVGSNEAMGYSWDKVCVAYESLYSASTQRSNGSVLG